MESILIKNAKIYTMDEKGIIERGDILIKDGKIAMIDNNINEYADHVIEAKDRLVFPGFIDAHSHIGMWEDSVGFEGADGNEDSDPVTPHLRAIDAINPFDRSFEEAIEGGVTCVATGPGSANVIGGQFCVIKTFGKRVDKMVVKEPAAMKVAFGENPKSVYHEKHQMPQTRMATAAILREALFKAREYLNKKLEAQQDEEKDMPEFDIKSESLIKVLTKEIPLKAHTHRADDIFTAIRIAKEFDVNLTLDHVTDGYLIVDELKQENIPCIVGPNLTDRSKVELKNLDFKNPGILSKNGILVAIMTDHPVIPQKYLVLCSALACKSGMDEIDALKAITINPAKILGIDNRVGSIKEGKDADIVIYKGHPFDIFSEVEYVLIDGKVVYHRK